MSKVTAVHTITTGPWKQNGYIVESISRAALIIDPGAEADRFIQLVNTRALVPVAILNTHAHYDHIGAVCQLMECFGDLSFYLHGNDRGLLRQANLYRSLLGAAKPVRVPSDFVDLAQFARSGLSMADVHVECIETPGHTKGSVCFRIEGHLFTGDTLLPKGPGRTDLPGGSAELLQKSVQHLRTFAGTLTMHPGHGDIVALADAQAHIDPNFSPAK